MFQYFCWNELLFYVLFPPGFTKVLVALGEANGDFTVVEIIDTEDPTVTCQNLPNFNFVQSGSPRRTIGGLNSDSKPFLCTDSGNCYTLENANWNKNNQPLNFGRSSSAFCKSPFPNHLLFVTGGQDSGIRFSFINSHNYYKSPWVRMIRFQYHRER